MVLTYSVSDDDDLFLSAMRGQDFRFRDFEWRVHGLVSAACRIK